MYSTIEYMLFRKESDLHRKNTKYRNKRINKKI